MTPSRMGRTTSIVSRGSRPSMLRASRPTALTFPSLAEMATTDGSLMTIPRPRTKTRTFAVPRSMPICFATQGLRRRSSVFDGASRGHRGPIPTTNQPVIVPWCHHLPGALSYPGALFDRRGPRRDRRPKITRTTLPNWPAERSASGHPRGSRRRFPAAEPQSPIRWRRWQPAGSVSLRGPDGA